MKKLKNLKTFLEFDPTQGNSEFNEGRLETAFASAMGADGKKTGRPNPFDDEDEYGPGKPPARGNKQKPKKNAFQGVKDRVNAVKGDVRRALWKTYKAPLDPIAQKAHKYIFNREA